MNVCIDAAALRKALAAIEAAEENGFYHCLAVLEITSAGSISDCRVAYSDLIERAHPTDASLNWGRFQGVTRRHKFRDGKLQPIRDSQ